jgi:hypothetical protein
MDAAKKAAVVGAVFPSHSGKAAPRNGNSVGGLDPHLQGLGPANKEVAYRTTIEDLPEEVLSEAFQKLRASKDWYSCLLVNKRWTTPACTAVTSIRLRRDSLITAKQLTARLPRFSSLTAVDATALARAVDDNILEAIAMGCPQLETLKLLTPSATDKGLQKLASSCPNLQRLELAHSEGFTVKGLEALGRGCPKLNTLVLDGAEFVNDQALAVLGLHFPALENLSLAGVGRCVWQKGGFSEQGLATLVASSRSLISLNLMRCERLRALPENLGDAENLKTLKLGFCRALLRLPGSLGKLERLEEVDLSSCTSLRRLPVEIGQLSSLRKLTAQLCSNLAELPSSICHLPALKDLDLSFCSSLSTLPDSLGSISTLKRLHLAGCTGLARLPSSLSMLKLEAGGDRVHAVSRVPS